jgi:uracil-DNA glycosylase family 4
VGEDGIRDTVVEEGDIALSIREKLQADLLGLRSAVSRCGCCSGGGKGLPGWGHAGAGIMLLAGIPGPGATERNPWGVWRDQLLEKACGEWGWDLDDAYLTTALRCPLKKVTHRDLRRCSRFLADEFFIVRPRIVIVSGKVATVALREALGDEIPANPKAGDVCTAFSTRFLFELDIARIAKEKEAASVFWAVLKNAEDIME